MPLAEQYACCAVSAFLKFAWAALSLTLARWFSSNTRTATATGMMITPFSLQLYKHVGDSPSCPANHRVHERCAWSGWRSVRMDKVDCIC